MKRFHFESLESRRVMTLGTIDIVPGPVGSNPTVVGTIGETIVALVSLPERSGRSVVGINAITGVVANLGDYTVRSAIDDGDYVVMTTKSHGIVVTDGTPEGTVTVPGDKSTLASYDGRVYWTGGGSTNTTGHLLTVYSTDGPISQFHGPIGICTEFDGCDFVRMIGVVDGHVYYQQSDIGNGFGEMRIYRDSENELLFTHPMIDIPFAPEFEAHRFKDELIFTMKTPMRMGLLEWGDTYIAADLIDVVFSDDHERCWYINKFDMPFEYDSQFGQILLSGKGDVIYEHLAAYNKILAPYPMPILGTFGLGKPIAAVREYGYAAFSNDSPEMGQELWLWEAAVGDVDYNGQFNSSDLVLIFEAGLYETGKEANWTTGDWNRDGVFDSSDLILAFQLGSYVS